MDVFEKMWTEFLQRLVLANQWSIRKEVFIQDVINLMASYEEHFKDEVEKSRSNEKEE